MYRVQPRVLYCVKFGFLYRVSTDLCGLPCTAYRVHAVLYRGGPRLGFSQMVPIDATTFSHFPIWDALWLSDPVQMLAGEGTNKTVISGS